MWKLKDSSTILKTSLIVVSVASVLHVVTFIAPYWIVSISKTDGSVSSNFGLWLNCVDSTTCSRLLSIPVWFRAVIIFECVAMAAGVTCFPVILYVIVSKKTAKWIVISTSVMPFIAAISMQVAASIFIKNGASGEVGEMSWCVAVNNTSLVLYIISGILLLTYLFRMFPQLPYKSMEV